MVLEDSSEGSHISLSLPLWYKLASGTDSKPPSTQEEKLLDVGKILDEAKRTLSHTT